MNTIKSCLYAKDGMCEKFKIKVSIECNECIYRVIDGRLKELDNLDFIQEIERDEKS